jgi:4-diphosphocytidyl-2C-methyl-D-erythritol kinase
MAEEEAVTGTRDKHYDLVSILYHTLEEADILEVYMEDAASEGDDELAEFFQQVQEEDRRRAERAKQLLARRLVS